MISHKQFAATAVIVLAIAAAVITTEPTATPAPAVVDSQKAAGEWFISQIENDQPDRAARALNMCLPLHMNRAGKVDWQKAKRCDEQI